MGQQKTLEKVKSKYIWFGMSVDCESYVRTYPVCNVNKKPNKHAKAGLGYYHAGVPLERVHIALMGPFVESNKENKYILMIIDQFTKWLNVIHYLTRKQRPWQHHLLKVSYLDWDVHYRSTLTRAGILKVVYFRKYVNNSR